MNPFLILLSLLAGAVLTWFLVVRRVTREVPVRRSLDAWDAAPPSLGHSDVEHTAGLATAAVGSHVVSDAVAAPLPDAALAPASPAGPALVTPPEPAHLPGPDVEEEPASGAGTLDALFADPEPRHATVADTQVWSHRSSPEGPVGDPDRAAAPPPMEDDDQAAAWIDEPAWVTDLDSAKEELSGAIPLVDSNDSAVADDRVDNGSAHAGLRADDDTLPPDWDAEADALTPDPILDTEADAAEPDWAPAKDDAAALVATGIEDDTPPPPITTSHDLSRTAPDDLAPALPGVDDEAPLLAAVGPAVVAAAAPAVVAAAASADEADTQRTHLAPSVPADADGGAPAGYAVKGDQRAGLYLLDSDPDFTRARADIWFTDEDAALAAGYAHYIRTPPPPAPSAQSVPPTQDAPARHQVEQVAPAASPYGPGTALAGADGSGPEGWEIKGNADSMLFHTTDSPWYGRTKAEVWFDTEDAARAAGFTRWNER